MNIFPVLAEKFCFGALRSYFGVTSLLIFFSNNNGKTHCYGNFGLLSLKVNYVALFRFHISSYFVWYKMSINCSSYAWSHLKLKCFIREVFNLRDVSRSRRLKQSVVGGDCEIKSPFNRSSQLIQLPTPPISPEPWNLITLYPKYFNITIAVGTRGIILTFLLYLFKVVNMCNKSASSRTDRRRKTRVQQMTLFWTRFQLT